MDSETNQQLDEAIRDVFYGCSSLVDESLLEPTVSGWEECKKLIIEHGHGDIVGELHRDN